MTSKKFKVKINWKNVFDYLIGILLQNMIFSSQIHWNIWNSINIDVFSWKYKKKFTGSESNSLTRWQIFLTMFMLWQYC